MQLIALIKTFAVALEQVKPKHLAGNWLMCRPRQTLGDSLSDLKTHALADTMADTLPELKASTLSLYSTLRNCEPLLHTLAETLAQTKVKIVSTN